MTSWQSFYDNKHKTPHRKCNRLKENLLGMRKKLNCSYMSSWQHIFMICNVTDTLFWKEIEKLYKFTVGDCMIFTGTLSNPFKDFLYSGTTVRLRLFLTPDCARKIFFTVFRKKLTKMIIQSKWNMSETCLKGLYH